MIVSSFVVDGVACGYVVSVLSFEVTGVFGGAARCGGQASGLPATLPGGAVEARRSRVALAPSRSDAAGALDLGGAGPHAAAHPDADPRIQQESRKRVCVSVTDLHTLGDVRSL